MRRHLTSGLLAALLSATVLAAVPASGLQDQNDTSRPEAVAAVDRGRVAALIDRAYDAAFNLNHDEAISVAREAVAAAPDHTPARRALASMLWMKILFLRGAVTVDHYMSGMSASQKHLPDPPADLDAELRAELARVIDLAETRLEQDPDDVEAQYDAGAAYGLQASYTASIEGSLRAAFRIAKSAFDAQEAVLEVDPAHASANVVVGTYRYLVSSLGLASRWLAYVAGFGGGKELGIGMIEQAFESGDSTVEAGTALLLIYSREGRHADGYRLALRLSERYPGNRLFLLEAGSAAVRAGLAAEAERVLTQGIARLDGEHRPRMPGERAVWLFKRGLARLQQNQPDRAAADFRAALASGPHGWLRGRIIAGQGKIHDLAGRRADAEASYREALAICEAFDDVIGADEVRGLLRRPFSMSGG